MDPWNSSDDFPVPSTLTGCRVHAVPLPLDRSESSTRSTGIGGFWGGFRPESTGCLAVYLESGPTEWEWL